jgi:hypothetical protein
LHCYFKECLLYQDKGSKLYYGDIDDSEQDEVTPLSQKRGKDASGMKDHETKERKSLVNKLLAWGVIAHLNDPLASV